MVFEAVRGKSPSTGGFSLDDINVSSMKCPQHIWHIRNITGLMATTPVGRKTYSPRFLSPAGYSFQVEAFIRIIQIHPFHFISSLQLLISVAKIGPYKICFIFSQILFFPF